MKSLYLRIYLTVVVAVALFALVSGWLVQRHLDEQRLRNEATLRERTAAWGELLQRSLPEAAASADEQEAALRDWSQRLRMPLALDDAQGKRLAASESYLRRERNGQRLEQMAQAIRFDDGRTLWVPRPSAVRAAIVAHAAGRGDARMDGRMDGRMEAMRQPWNIGAGLPFTFMWQDGRSLALLLALLFIAVAVGAWPVVRRLTRRLEALKQGVDTFGAGALNHRVAEDGRDEVAALATSFNRAASRVETLVRSHQSLLANASHELRSPLARLKMAVAMLESPGQNGDTAHPALRKEINTNIAELDALVEEVLLASRLEAAMPTGAQQPVELRGLVAEEAVHTAAQVQPVVGDDAPSPLLMVLGEERLLRRAVRNLLENARRYGGSEVQVALQQRGLQAELRVCDRGPGVPEVYRERIFEAFFRLPGHAEREGGVGLGLALVRQIAHRSGGEVRCEARAGGGSCFVLSLPLVTGAT